MESTFEITRSSRNVLLHFLESHSLAQLNTVPQGFNNNIIWNVAHCIVVQQLLVYKLSGQPMMIPTEMVDRYKRGTKPGADVTPEELEEIKSLLFPTIDKTQCDFTAGLFKSYNNFTTMSGMELTNAATAMEFNNYHEGVHTGIIMNLRKLI